MWDGRSAHTEFHAFGWDQGGNWGGGRWKRIVRRNWFHPLRCAARVVAVKTESTLYIELRLGPRAENQSAFWARQELGGGAGIELRKVDHWSARQFGGDIRGSQAGDVIYCLVAAHGQDPAEFFRPLDFISHIKTNHRVGESIQIG